MIFSLPCLLARNENFSRIRVEGDDPCVYALGKVILFKCQ